MSRSHVRTRQFALFTANSVVESASHSLLQDQGDDDYTNSTTIISGYISAVRGFGKSFCFVDITTKYSETTQTILKRQDYQGPRFDGIRRTMLPGVKIKVKGIMTLSRNQEESMLIQEASIIGWPRNPQHVRVILDAVSNGELSQSIDVPIIPDGYLEQIRDNQQSSYSLAKEIVKTLPMDDDYPSELFSILNSGEYTLPLAPDEAIKIPQVTECTVTISSLDAVVSTRRRYDGNITVIELVDKANASNRYMSIIHPELGETSNMMGNILGPTSRVVVDGWLHEHTGGVSMLWITKCQVMRVPWQPKTIEYVLDAVIRGEYERTDAAMALGLSDAELEPILMLETTTERQWKAAELSQQIQQQSTHDVGIPEHATAVLDLFQNVRKQYPLDQHELLSNHPEVSFGLTNFSKDGSRWRRKKEPQLDWMLNQVEQLITSHPEHGQRLIRLLDIGGGKGLLANHLAKHMNETIEIEVIDIAERAIKNGAMRSRRLQLPVSYTVADASQIRLAAPVDLVVALHACGTLTDVALGHAVMNNASFVVCPCCFCSHPHLQVPVRGDTTTSASLDVYSWLNVKPNDYDPMKRLAELQGELVIANAATHSICALRARAVECESSKDIKVSIKTFPIAFSTRNFCMVGQRQWNEEHSNM